MEMSVFENLTIVKGLITAQEVFVFGIILVRIFPHLLRISLYSVRMRENGD